MILQDPADRQEQQFLEVELAIESVVNNEDEIKIMDLRAIQGELTTFNTCANCLRHANEVNDLVNLDAFPAQPLADVRRVHRDNVVARNADLDRLVQHNLSLIQNENLRSNVEYDLQCIESEPSESDE